MQAIHEASVGYHALARLAGRGSGAARDFAASGTAWEPRDEEAQHFSAIMDLPDKLLQHRPEA